MPVRVRFPSSAPIAEAIRYNTFIRSRTTPTLSQVQDDLERFPPSKRIGAVLWKHLDVRGATTLRAAPKLDVLVAVVNSNVDQIVDFVNGERDNELVDIWRATVMSAGCEDAHANWERLIDVGV